MWSVVFVCQAEDGIRDLVRSRGLGDVYKRQLLNSLPETDVVGEATSGASAVEMALALRPDVILLSLIHI